MPRAYGLRHSVEPGKRSNKDGAGGLQPALFRRVCMDVCGKCRADYYLGSTGHAPLSLGGDENTSQANVKAWLETAQPGVIAAHKWQSARHKLGRLPT